jgi:hypothetical protein
MKTDVYIRIVLTIIAACLVANVWHGLAVIPTARAATPTTCTGEMKATTAGPMQASIGSSYQIRVTCN